MRIERVLPHLMLVATTITSCISFLHLCARVCALLVFVVILLLMYTQLLSQTVVCGIVVFAKCCCHSCRCFSCVFGFCQETLIDLLRLLENSAVMHSVGWQNNCCCSYCCDPKALLINKNGFSSAYATWIEMPVVSIWCAAGFNFKC